MGNLQVFFKKKKTIAGIVIILAGFLLTTIFGKMYQATIREQQIESVVKVAFKNKQFKSIQESEVSELLKSKELTIIGLIDSSDNKGYSKIQAMFDSKTAIEGLPATVYIFQPIYDSTKLNKSLKIKEKNTFLLIQNGEEIGRVAFNDFSGHEELVKEMDAILNPKIPRKNPVRNEKEESDEEQTGQEQEEKTTTSDSETHTSEVKFE